MIIVDTIIQIVQAQAAVTATNDVTVIAAAVVETPAIKSHNTIPDNSK